MTMDLTPLAKSILEARYLLKNENGEVIESPEEMLARVVQHVSQVNRKRMNTREFREYKENILQMLVKLDFLPNSPTLMNAGTMVGQLSACFVLPVEDSIDGIFDAVKNMAKIHKSGGGTGFSFSALRPKGDIIKSTMGESSGPLSFMNVFDSTTSAITQGGRRRGANMGIMNVNHPDIEAFISAKEKLKILQNFNLSVAVTDEFIESVKNNSSFNLINPRNQKIESKVNANVLFDSIAKAAWTCGDPGLIFIDEINRKNPTPALGPIASTNPCGEIPLYPFESCNLGSINLVHVVKNGKVSWGKLEEITHQAIGFLDDVIDANSFPLPEIDLETKKNRKIGLGIMGFADALILLGIKYNSMEGLRVGEKIMKFINERALEKSKELGLERGSFPNFPFSIYREKHEAMRNATRTAIAPTGTISIIAGVSSGIEPIFSLFHERLVDSLGKVDYFHPLLVKMLDEGGHDTAGILDKVKDTKGIDPTVLPGNMADLFIPAFQVSPEHHVRMQATFQAHVDNSVSKTVNLPRESDVKDVKDVFLLAHELGCKGITVYRYGSRKEQVLNLH